MESHSQDELEGRRAFLGKLAVAGAAGFAIANGGFTGASELHAATLGTIAPMADEHWLDKLSAKHKQLVDAYNANEGWPLGFTHTFLATQNAAAGTHGAVLVLRHTA